MIDLPSLFPHQEDLRDRTRSALAKHGRVILCAGCGVGKTRTAKWVLGSSANRKPRGSQTGKSLFVVQGRGLVLNASDSFNESPRLPHGVIMSGEKSAFGFHTQVASIDTMLSWFVEGKEYPSDITFDLIVSDEAEHHFTKFARFLKAHDRRRVELGLHPAFVIGLTATPQAKGLADVYRDIVFAPPTTWLIENGFLAPFRYFRATQGKLEKLVLRGGEYTKKSECEAMDGLAGDLVRDWKRFAEGRPTVGFFPRRSHAKEAMQELKDAGIRAAYVDCETSDEARERIFWELNNHRIDYLCNVDLVGRGTDIPAISCVQLCVAIGSEKAFIQKVGRGSRVDDGVREDGNNVPAKKDCLVIDHGPSLSRHGFFEDPRQWTLDISTKDPGEQGTRPTIECPQCQAIYRGGKCNQCGYEPTPKERKSQGLEFDGSELKEVKPSEKKKKVKPAKEIMLSCLYRAGQRGLTWKQAVGLFKRESEKQGTNYRVPSKIEVAGCEYSMIRYGSLDGGRRVADLYPFTNGDGHGGNYFLGESVLEEIN